MEKLSDILEDLGAPSVKRAQADTRVVARLLTDDEATRELLELRLYHPEYLAETLEMLAREAPDAHGALGALRGAFLTKYGQTHHRPDCPRCNLGELKWEPVDG